MDGVTAAPAIPQRTRNPRRQSVPTTAPQPRSSETNRVQVQPASPEVISSLISSLAIISSPAHELFEEADEVTALGSSPRNTYGYNLGTSKRGSFGVDYGAFKQASHDQYAGPLDELAATPPIVRTSKPPSGFSPLTAPKSPVKDGSLKSFLRVNSRPSSRTSNNSKDHDEVSSIGNLSIEPGDAPRELRRVPSTDSWGKKQGGNPKGLRYATSKERLRDTGRKQTNNALNGATKGLGIDRAPGDQRDNSLAQRPISEEAESPNDHTEPSSAGMRNPAALQTSAKAIADSDPGSPALSSHSQGSLASPRQIPARESSLRPRSTNTNKRTSKSNQSSRHSEGLREDEAEGTSEYDAERPERRQNGATENRYLPKDISADPILKMLQPLRSPPSPEPKSVRSLASRQVTERAKVDKRQTIQDAEEGAPSPAIAQRKVRPNADMEGNVVKTIFHERKTPEPLEMRPADRDSANKRMSAPLSPPSNSKESHHRSASQPLSNKEAVTADPTTSQRIDDRPSSADSIDDAVDSYLCSPRLSQKIRHPHTGRAISFSEVGDPEGFAVFCCVGMGLTRYITAFYDELALTLKLRLITPDRPGVGESEAYTDGTATPLSWPDDVYAICQTLKITKFSILAHSAGAIYALATALRMPQHIRGHIHLLAPWIPPSQLNVIGAQTTSLPSGSIPTSQRILRALPTPILKAANSSFMSATSSSITSSLPRSPRRAKRKVTNGRDTPAGRNSVAAGLDKENQGPNSVIYPKPTPSNAFDQAAKNLQDPNSEAAVLAAAASTLAQKERQSAYDARLTQAIWDLATTNANPAVDLLVCLERRHTIGFRYVDINRAVIIHHGTKDTRVPVENVKWLGKMMRRCEVRILEGEGHGLMASASVMGGVLMEIAKEWDDWMRVVQLKSNDPKGRTLRERASVGAFR